MYSITARWMNSGLVWKHPKGLGLVIQKNYLTALTISSRFLSYSPGRSANPECPVVLGYDGLHEK